MEQDNFFAVIMAGGIGSRFWPVSTTQFPKQFHDMLGTGQSLLQKTFSRLEAFIPSQNISVLTNERYQDLCLGQLPNISKNQVVLEPAMRNTAPCILLSALKIYKQNPKALMLVAPSDHWIEDEKAFKRDVETSFRACALQSILMTLGIRPTFPNTGYGYIESDNAVGESIKPVKQFCEKPNYEKAKAFLAAGNFSWNAGIFIWSVESILDAFKNWMPEMYGLFVKGMDVFNTPSEAEFIQAHYHLAENISIDYAIMEKAPNVFVKEASFDWNDLGTWGALHEKLDKDPFGNAVVRALPYLKDAKGNMIYSDRPKLIVVDGVDDYIIVDKENVLLLYPKSKEQNIKKLLTEISHTFGENYT
ncbi:MAG TPA: mannose-1-phosphate guanylyltransferase [Flavobacteriaceae bacterium]|nr:mannose-1-phosphate guanylyltransferase [Flavobacteriaceae bacterium]MCB9212858.1 mannose-1-phosphate guanylyltransferase [Alteromonas sp.]HPF11470.1 mannose-1-phosphate guanylyltransferase [Flavobacteriaceae bacterium]HQU20633.1 mannose-1-phosphate guanylyltransferase [Flavobacteriaceae bacterium]HQU65044.1 mannose-1-phosphate guanylyltransferase [Flavobacteriaceae bacterium]